MISVERQWRIKTWSTDPDYGYKVSMKTICNELLKEYQSQQKEIEVLREGIKRARTNFDLLNSRIDLDQAIQKADKIKDGKNDN